MSKSISLDYDIAKEYGVNAALVLNELSFWNGKGKRKDGWIYKSYEDMVQRVPLSESTIRRCYRTLEDAGLITTQVMKVDNVTYLHYKLTDPGTVNLTDPIGTTKLTDRYIHTESNHRDGKFLTKNKENSNSDASFGGNEAPNAIMDPATLLQQIIKIVNPREKPTVDRISNVKGRLKDGYTPEEILGAAKALSKSEWHKENHQMSVDNLVRASKFGRWYQASLDPLEKTGPSDEEQTWFEEQERINKDFREGKSDESSSKEF